MSPINVVITVTGGVVQDVAVDDARINDVNVILVDFDNIEHGDDALVLTPSRISDLGDGPDETMQWAAPLLA
jgi:hypothetical protein